MATTDVCGAVDPFDHGDDRPVTCTEPAGHTGDHFDRSTVDLPGYGYETVWSDGPARPTGPADCLNRFDPGYPGPQFCDCYPCQTGDPARPWSVGRTVDVEPVEPVEPVDVPGPVFILSADVEPVPADRFTVERVELNGDRVYRDRWNGDTFPVYRARPDVPADHPGICGSRNRARPGTGCLCM